MHNGITDVKGIKIGHYTDEEGITGCRVVLGEGGAAGDVDVRGSAPGTRETDLMRPMNLVQEIHAVLLTGGSAYGLDTASGVMRWLEEHGVGAHVGVGYPSYLQQCCLTLPSGTPGFAPVPSRLPGLPVSNRQAGHRTSSHQPL